ncbi:Uncharacterised protein [Bordetella ansorpii]|uniref:Uncharacterized protein n=1 Tax=Bordetella ansorpii TaxID=288768 RepID=A0A157RN75_9BORD|nr:hypothetical protein [Bordetella ansorpii]SAI58869.1 Uncharacterised protein [Bordetella ansorpii]
MAYQMIPGRYAAAKRAIELSRSSPQGYRAIDRAKNLQDAVRLVAHGRYPLLDEFGVNPSAVFWGIIARAQPLGMIPGKLPEHDPESTADYPPDPNPGLIEALASVSVYREPNRRGDANAARFLRIAQAHDWADYFDAALGAVKAAKEYGVKKLSPLRVYDMVAGRSLDRGQQYPGRSYGFDLADTFYRGQRGSPMAQAGYSEPAEFTPTSGQIPAEPLNPMTMNWPWNPPRA